MRTVLIVDDEPQLLRALQVNLQAEGYQVLTALDGATALKHAEGGHPMSSSLTWACRTSTGWM